MNKSSVSSVVIAGAGFMGNAIAYLIATRSQAKVCLYDKYPSALKKAEITFAKFGQTAIEKNLITIKDLENARNNLTTTDNLDKLPDSQLLIEAIIEDLIIKQDLFKILDQKLPAATIFATNTSSLSITALAPLPGAAINLLACIFSPQPIL